jgi:hypothetical protein
MYQKYKKKKRNVSFLGDFKIVFKLKLLYN